MNNPFGQDINEDVKNLLEEMEETSGFNGLTDHPQKITKPETAAKHTKADKPDTAAELEKMLEEVEEAVDAAESEDTGDISDAPAYAADGSAEEEQSSDTSPEEWRDQAKAAHNGTIAGLILLLALYCFQYFRGQGANYGICAVVFCMLAVERLPLAIQRKKTFDIVMGVIYLLLAIYSLVLHLMGLLGA